MSLDESLYVHQVPEAPAGRPRDQRGMPIPQNFGRDHYGCSRPREAGALNEDDRASQRASHESRKHKKNSEAHTQPPEQRGSDLMVRPSSRQELIARIKQEARPQWLQSSTDHDASSTPQRPECKGLEDPADNVQEATGSESAGQSIERPRSALHRGDFRESSSLVETTPDNGFHYHQHQQHFSTSPPIPWQSSYGWPPTRRNPGQTSTSVRPALAQGRNRAASQSSQSSSFIFRPPTSPLVLQTNNIDSDDECRARSRSPSKSSRRRTFSPGALQSARRGFVQSLGPPPSFPTFRREETFPRQAHQPRRSISSLHSFSTPQTPLTRSRRASLMSEASPLQGTQMVGGYEESILRGRMSSQASKPFDFVARIGVLGKGNCKSSLRCPPHISVPFPAVFYHYGRSASGHETGPSPYVGHIDLEGRETSDGSKDDNDSSRRTERVDLDGNVPMLSINSSSAAHIQSTRQARQSSKSKRPPLGSYRIPQQGQLQIIIKNPHKTAVKLFLVPYDISDMQPGQRTFIRQRSYSAGPILDMPLDARRNLGTDRPEAALSNSEDPNERPILRYLIHLQICCPSKGKFYLYRNIRVVFANRVPDGKEKLRNEVQLPQPRYSTYKSEVDQTSADRHPLRTRGSSIDGNPGATIYYAAKDDTTSSPAGRIASSKMIAEATPNGSAADGFSDRSSPKIVPRSPAPRPINQLHDGTLSFERRSKPEPHSRRPLSPHTHRQDGLLALQLRGTGDDHHDTI